MHWPAVSLSLSISICLACSTQKGPPPGGGGGARESRHVAKAPRKSGLAGKGGPWSPGKEIEGPLALGARSLAAVLLAALERSGARCERAAAASGEARMGGICGARKAAELRGKADAVQRPVASHEWPVAGPLAPDEAEKRREGPAVGAYRSLYR